MDAGASNGDVAAAESGETDQGAVPPNPFEGIIGRHSADYLLRNSQDQLVALGGQADFKASVMITASSIIASVAASQLGDGDLGWAAGVLMFFILFALIASVLAVFPKFSTHRQSNDELPPHFNPLFFGHYAGISKEHFLAEMAAVLRDDAEIYRSISRDIHDQGTYLVRAKYRYLRVSYVCFLSGWVGSGIALVVAAL
jgi:hypothetical protein